LLLLVVAVEVKMDSPETMLEGLVEVRVVSVQELDYP